MVYVVAGTYRQFYYWCTFRHWSVRDKGIKALIRAEDFCGVCLRPGDLVIELEFMPGEVHYHEERDRAESYRVIKERAPSAVSFRFETPLPPERGGKRRIIQ